MRDFKGKVAAVTGAGSGIGRALAVELASRGCNVALCDVKEEGLAETAEAARKHGVRVTAETMDVSQQQAMFEWADRVVAEHGKANLVFNNAGVALMTTVESATMESLEWIMGINFWGVIYGTKAFLPHLKASGDGHVINISSVFGLMGVPSQSGYNAAKFAVRGFTECLRQELDMMQCGVSATSVHPGGIKTNIVRHSRQDESVLALGMELDHTGDNFKKSVRTHPEEAARIILRAVERNKRRVLVGPDAHFIDIMVRLFPTSYQKILPFVFQRMNNKKSTA